MKKKRPARQWFLIICGLTFLLLKISCEQDTIKIKDYDKQVYECMIVQCGCYSIRSCPSDALNTSFTDGFGSQELRDA